MWVIFIQWRGNRQACTDELSRQEYITIRGGVNQLDTGQSRILGLNLSEKNTIVALLLQEGDSLLWPLKGGGRGAHSIQGALHSHDGDVEELRRAREDTAQRDSVCVSIVDKLDNTLPAPGLNNSCPVPQVV
jgi:hypothetical protein